MTTPHRPSLREAFAQRVLLLDGAMGSLIQEYGYQGNYDQLALTHPEVLHDVARRYLEAGADVITTCTFSAQRISQAEYHLDDQVTQINHAAARIAVEEARRFTALDPQHPRYVLGDVGPTSKMLSMSDDVSDPAARAITFDQLEAAYLEQIQALLDEGVDGILIETIFDTLNAKAALSAFEQAVEARRYDAGQSRPEVLLSMTVSDASGRTLSGQTVQAFVTSVLHARPLSVGINCGMGADAMLPYLRQMSACAPCYVSCHPNAGLPNQFGGYDHTPQQMVTMMKPFVEERLANMIGGCCGTTPAHIAAFRQLIDGCSSAPRIPASMPDSLTLAGLEPLTTLPVTAGMPDAQSAFVTVGERCNVAGSRKFLRLINEKNYDEALDIARRQIEDGAQVIDINMDDGLLDARHEMQTFINLLMSDPSISRVPLMIDSSRFDVIEAGLKCAQGKCIVNSISLKQGQEAFVRHARKVHSLGAAVIFMLFDEEGQATDYERRIRIAERGYRLLVDEVGFLPTDIIIDPNVLTVATGMAEHNAYAADFIRATRWITDHLPGVRISGGLSNLSFAFRGNNYLRESMHSVFLHHAIANGMGMAIMNPASAVGYRTIPLELRMAITEVVLNTYASAPDELMEIAQRMTTAQQAAKEAGQKYDPKAIFAATATTAAEAVAEAKQATSDEALTPALRLQQSLVKGITTTVEADVLALIHDGLTPLQIISGPLMEGMNTVGQLFGEGKMFLPQVVKTARTMKKAVEVLNPFMSAQQDVTEAGPDLPKILLATVKGDVHDIGKNIVGVVLACNNFKVIDLGVMVPTETIIAEALAQKVDFVCLSGLITPSLEEMCNVARAMQEAGMTIPLFVGGATTSAIHTAVKIAPLYDGGVFHLTDAAKNPVLAMQLMDDAQRDSILRQNREQQAAIRLQQAQKATTPEVVPSPSDVTTAVTDWSRYQPAPVPFVSQRVHAPIALSELIPLIDWTYFYWPWRVKADSDEGRNLRADADALLHELQADPAYDMQALTAFYPARGGEGQIEVRPDGSDSVIIATPTTAKGNTLCHYVSPAADHVGLFAATVSPAFIQRLEGLKRDASDDYSALLLQTVGDVLAEAASEYLQRELEATGWHGIRPAVGYPLLPDQRQIFRMAKLIDYTSIGITLTENGAMYPQSSVSGLYIGHPQATY